MVSSAFELLKDFVAVKLQAKILIRKPPLLNGLINNKTRSPKGLRLNSP